ncbi:hypothetical protein NsoK4_09405 [Nitrosopumilus sp. K4]|uniref:RNA-binding domain-containing protein n=1 Tax=Nitrosopumilus sp. K4 TaxID=2795383 RepID=UPI001BA6F9C2|nr:RNA-binding domain-containing protein [Nitrosopumilus sp. K4]QUC64618.1 hypothetical protein NsoK4_09405 [Nitrosopumilus sp. K4]
MRFPNLNCKIQIFSPLNPSEDPEKIKKSISNVLSGSTISFENFSIKGESDNLESLEKIYETIHSRQSQRVLQRQLVKHSDKNTTWFYLNKQAAFVEKIVLCEEADESPLGPLKVILTSPTIDKVIDFLVFED